MSCAHAAVALPVDLDIRADMEVAVIVALGVEIISLP